MTVRLSNDEINFENPNKKSIEELTFKVVKDGIVKEIPACDSYWIEERSHARYPGFCPINTAEKSQWLEKMDWFNKELEWLLQLEHFRFWSQMCYDNDCMAFILSFLQEASPFYAPFVSEDKEVMEAYKLAYQRVLQIFCRLVTNKESEFAWTRKSYLAELLYKRYLISIPILWDLTVVYGRENAPILSKLIETIFKIEPKYTDDLNLAFNFLKEVFTVVEAHAGGSTTSKIIPLNNSSGPSQAALGDLVLHLLDCAATMSLFLELYVPARNVARKVNLPISIAHLYDTAIPLLFSKITDKKCLVNIGSARVELLQAYNLILYSCVEDVLQNPSEGLPYADEYVEIVSESLTSADTSRLFFADLQNIHSLQSDLELLRQTCPTLDSVKCDFILQSLLVSLDDSDAEKNPAAEFAIPGEDFAEYNHISGAEGDNINLEGAVGGDAPAGNIETAISEVLDVLPHLGGGFIHKLLKHFETPEKVISAILEGNLPDELATLDQSQPFIPEDPQDKFYLESGIRRNNIFDGDEYDLMNSDVVKDGWKKGKGKKGPKNFSALINDKSHVRELSQRYEKYSIINDNVYDDELDDSYDGPVTQGAEEGPGVFSRRPTEMPRVLQQFNPNESESEPEVEDETPDGPPPNRDMFCENPEVIRARYEAKRNQRVPSGPQRDVVGKGKGHGQEKDVVIGRDKKNTQKSSRANHNRRQGAQFKRSRGMLPS